MLIHRIELKTYEKYLLGQSNFDKTLPDSIKNQAVLAVKDDYSFGFTGLDDGHSEYELEQAIVKNIRAFLMEFGGDFSFIGNQYRLVVEDNEYFIDLMLYSRTLQALIAIELKHQPTYRRCDLQPLAHAAGGVQRVALCFGGDRQKDRTSDR